MGFESSQAGIEKNKVGIEKNREKLGELKRRREN